MAKYKVVHYINQFFAGIGGEEKADIPAELHKGEVIGPGMAFNQGFG
ncbi:MAG: glycine/betaine/sarcosine/D-proline family reductase selenoprotein B, partial [Mogibacterium sp.]|nr:glycine/betaine/sarcosine/D-proline family reductase selenoprotein B [Mogibacterium sp.]